MKASSVLSLTPLAGIRGRIVRVEAAVRRGIPSFQICGGPYSSRSQTDRLRTAIASSGFSFPYAVVSVHLAPADLRKSGAQLDLAVAGAILKATGDLPSGSILDRLPAETTVLLGELSLSGRIHSGPYLPSLVLEARRLGMTDAVIPSEHAERILVPGGLRLHLLDNLCDLTGNPRAGTAVREPYRASRITSGDLHLPLPENVARALAVSAAGRHNILLIGPPGTGKTTAARILPALLPPPGALEMEEIAAYAHMGRQDDSPFITRPVRAPHHLTTPAGLVGGGNPPVPGEVTRAHCGVLILDELAEFSMTALQALREPVEDGVVRVARNAGAVELPARFLLAGTTNACPCGFHMSAAKTCTCPRTAVRGYLNRILGPLRDRLDLEIGTHDLTQPRRAVAHWLPQIERAQQLAEERAQRSHNDVSSAPFLGAKAQRSLESILQTRMGAFRFRAALLRVARTLADLRGSGDVEGIDLEEAAAMRILDTFALE